MNNASRRQGSFAFFDNNQNNNNIINSKIKKGSEVNGNCGVEAVVVFYDDVTGLDFNPRLTTSRLAIEAQHIRTFYFPSYHAALAYFQHRTATMK